MQYGDSMLKMWWALANVHIHVYMSSVCRRHGEDGWMFYGLWIGSLVFLADLSIHWLPKVN